MGHFDSFQDECYLVLKTLCPPPSLDNAAGSKFVSEWLTRNGFSCAGDFLGRTGNIQKFIDMFTNGLKHANQRLNLVTGAIDGHRIIGFFIEELRANQVREYYRIAPEDLWNKPVAFSFNKILRELLLAYYQVCDALEFVIKDHIKKVHGIKFTQNIIRKHGTAFGEMLNKISLLEEVFFPYEYKKFGRIELRASEMKLSYPHSDGAKDRKSLTAYAYYGRDRHSRPLTAPVFE